MVRARVGHGGEPARLGLGVAAALGSNAMAGAPDRWGELGEYIREQRATARLSLRRLSKLAGVSNPYLSQIERGLRRPSAEILQQIARALRISAETLYVRAGILEDRQGDHDLVGAILRDRTLTEDQRQILLHLYRSFGQDNDRARAEGRRVDEVDAGTSASAGTASIRLAPRGSQSGTSG